MAFYNNIGEAIDVLEKLSSDVGNVFLGQGREKKIMFNFLRNVAKDKNGEFLKDFLNPEDDLLRNGFVGLLGACKKHDAALILIWLPTQLICFLKISMFLESF